MTRDVSRSVCFSTQLRFLCGDMEFNSVEMSTDAIPGCVRHTHAPPIERREGNHFLRSPWHPVCIRTVRQITGPASPVMRTGVAEAGRVDCKG